MSNRLFKLGQELQINNFTSKDRLWNRLLAIHYRSSRYYFLVVRQDASLKFLRLSVWDFGAGSLLLPMLPPFCSPTQYTAPNVGDNT